MSSPANCRSFEWCPHSRARQPAPFHARCTSARTALPPDADVAVAAERGDLGSPRHSLEANPPERAAAKIVEQGRRGAGEVWRPGLDQVSARGDERQQAVLVAGAGKRAEARREQLGI